MGPLMATVKKSMESTKTMMNIQKVKKVAKTLLETNLQGSVLQVVLVNFLAIKVKKVAKTLLETNLHDSLLQVVLVNFLAKKVGKVAKTLLKLMLKCPLEFIQN